MRDITPEIESITLGLVEWEKKISSAAKVLKEKNKVNGRRFLEDSLFVKVDSLDKESITVGGIDGGLLKKEYHGINIILTRAVCAVFHYQSMKLSGSEYFPSPFPTPQIKIQDSSFNDSDFMAAASIVRLNSELGLAYDMLGKDIDLLLLDGSVLLHPSVRVERGSRLRQDYDVLLKTVRNMYSESIDNHVPLAGVVEDSRSQAFVKSCDGIVDAETMKCLDNVKDTHFLTHCLSVGERTSIFRTIDMDAGDEMPADIKGFENNLFSFYIRPSEFDRALRIDFVAGDDSVPVGSWIASAVFSMSRHNSMYGIPPVIIDADQRAKLPGDELLFVEREIRKRVGNLSSFSELRRNSRPI